MRRHPSKSPKMGETKRCAAQLEDFQAVGSALAMTESIYCNNNFDESVLVVLRGSRTIAKQKHKLSCHSAGGQLTEKSALKRKCGSENTRNCMRAPQHYLSHNLSAAPARCSPSRKCAFRAQRLTPLFF